MAIVFDCEKCGKVLRVKDGNEGRKMRCPGCQSAQQVPSSDDEEFGDPDEYGQYDDSQEFVPTRRSKRKSGSSDKRRSRPSTSRGGVLRWLVMLWPIELFAAILLIGLIYPKAGSMVGLLSIVGGVCLLGYGFLGGMIAIASSNPGHFFSSIFAPLYSQMHMSDSERKKLRAATSPYMSAGGRGLLLGLLGGVSFVICMDWDTARKIARNRELMQNRFAVRPGNVPRPPAPRPDSPTESETRFPGSTGRAVKRPIAFNSTQPSSFEARRTQYSTTNKPTVNRVVAVEVDGRYELFVVKELLPNDRVKMLKMVRDGDTDSHGTRESKETDVGQLRGTLPADFQ